MGELITNKAHTERLTQCAATAAWQCLPAVIAPLTNNHQVKIEDSIFNLIRQVLKSTQKNTSSPSLPTPTRSQILGESTDNQLNNGVALYPMIHRFLSSTLIHTKGKSLYEKIRTALSEKILDSLINALCVNQEHTIDVCKAQLKELLKILGKKYVTQNALKKTDYWPNKYALST